MDKAPKLATINDSVKRIPRSRLPARCIVKANGNRTIPHKIGGSFPEPGSSFFIAADAGANWMVSVMAVSGVCAGKVHEVPFVIDRKMIDQLRFAGSAGCLGQFVIVAKHIDQRRLADVAAADKGVLRPVWLWTLEIVRAADDINGRANDHAVE